MMPDQTVDLPETERQQEAFQLGKRIAERAIAADRPPILDTIGPHEYKESEFPEGKGHCDLCGGGPDAKIHNHVDPLERIAEALERGAVHLEAIRDEAQQQTECMVRGVAALENLVVYMRTGR
jgi:hypothetical protein